MKKIILFFAAILVYSNFCFAQPFKLEYTVWPVLTSGYNVQAIYGENTQSESSVFHDGLDIFCAAGTYVVAARSGIIKSIRIDTLRDNDNIIIEVALIDNPTLPTHKEYDLYLHIKPWKKIDSLMPVNAGDTIGTVNAQEHLHFTRFRSYNQDQIAGYFKGGSNCMNPLSNFALPIHKDPTLALPQLKKLNTEPSFIFKRNLYGNHFRLTELSNSKIISLEKKIGIPADLILKLNDYCNDFKNINGFETINELQNHITQNVSHPQLSAFMPSILSMAENQKLVLLPYPVDSKPYTIYGDVDILVEAYDKFSDFAAFSGSTVNSISYWVENISGNGANVLKNGLPYKLFTLYDSLMYDLAPFKDSINELEMRNYTIYDPELQDTNKYHDRLLTHFAVTNTDNTTGKVANMKRNQYWRTLAKKNTLVEPNGYNAQLASNNEQAAFADGFYRVHCSLYDLLPEHNTEVYRDVIIDNFKPYIKKVSITQNNITVYSAVWQTKPDSLKLLAGVCGWLKKIASYDAVLTITTGEPMDSVNVSIPGLKWSCKKGDTDTNSKDTVWTFTIPYNKIDSVSNTLTSASKKTFKIIITGKDYNQNEVQGFNTSKNYILMKDLCHRNNTGNWEPAIDILPDEFHYLTIGSNTKSSSVCINPSFSSTTTGNMVQFTDQSSSMYTINSWSWDFGDGFASTTQNPQHSYTVPGSFTVKLRVSDGVFEGETTQSVKVNIENVTPVAAMLPATPVTIQVGEQVQFTDISQGAHTAQWLFEGGTPAVSAIQNPTVTYSIPGVYKVTLTVKQNELSNTLEKTGFVTVTAPTGSQATVYANNPAPNAINPTVGFHAVITGGTAPFVYLWNFGDGSTATDAAPSHTYTQTGSYTVALKITDAQGKVFYGYTPVSYSEKGGWVSADGCSTGLISNDVCITPSDNELLNPDFENTGGVAINFWPDCNNEFPFGVSPKVIQGNWYASHGTPAVLHGRADGSAEGSLIIEMGTSSEYNAGTVIKKSEGMYYQLPENLNPAKIYKLRFMVQGLYDMFQNLFNNIPVDTILDKLHICLTSGLQPYTYQSPTCPSNYNNYSGENQFLPSYPFSLHKLGSFDFSLNWDWNCVEISFIPPKTGNFNQIWIYPESVILPNPLTNTYYADWVRLDNFSLTSQDYYPKELVFTGNTNLPVAIRASEYITAGSGTIVQAGKTVVMGAGKKIVLTNGFTAKSGSNFTAKIIPLAKSNEKNCECVNENYLPKVHFPVQTDVQGSYVIKRFEDKRLNKNNKNIEQKFTIYPNPAQNEVNISFSGAATESFHFELINITGKTIYSSTVNSNNYKFNISGFSKGAYILKLKTKSINEQIKLIIN